MIFIGAEQISIFRAMSGDLYILDREHWFAFAGARGDHTLWSGTYNVYIQIKLINFKSIPNIQASYWSTEQDVLNVRMFWYSRR